MRIVMVPEKAPGNKNVIKEREKIEWDQNKKFVVGAYASKLNRVFTTPVALNLIMCELHPSVPQEA